MKAKFIFLPFLMIPGIILFTCNPLTHKVLEFSSLGPTSYLRNLMILVTLLYGIYLNVCRAPKGSHGAILLVTGIVGLSLSYLGFSGWVWLAAFALVFSGMRMMILEQALKTLPKDLTAFFLGIFIATLLTPLSLIAGVAGFLLVQVIYEIRFKEEGNVFVPDRFQESQRTAERILKEFS